MGAFQLVASLGFAAVVTTLAHTATADENGPPASDPRTDTSPEGPPVADAPAGAASQRLEPLAASPRAQPPVVVFAPPPPLPGEPEPEAPRERPGTKLEDGGLELALGTMVFQPLLGDAFFDGQGKPIGGAGRENFHHRGRELGVGAPLMWGGQISAYYLRRYFAVGVMGFYAGHPGMADVTPSPSNTLASSQVNPDALMAYGGGLDLAAAAPFGRLALRPGAVLGIRGFAMPMSGFEPTTCHSKRGPYPCPEKATTNAQLFLEPRLRIEISPDTRSGFVFGATIGMEVAGGASPTAGLFIGFNTRHDSLQP